jgi:hypothetical protein
MASQLPFGPLIAFLRRFTAADDDPEEIMGVYCGLLDLGQPVILTLAEILADESLGLEVECVVLLESLGQILNIRPALPALWKTANKCPKDRARFVAVCLILKLDSRRAAKLFTIMDDLRSSPDENVRKLADEKLWAMARWGGT